MRRTGVIFAVIVFAASVAACGGSSSNPTPASPSADSLETIVSRVVPKDFKPVEAGSGTYDLAGASMLGSDNAAERNALERNGFVRAFFRLWRKGDTSVAILAYEFRAEAGATAYESYSIDDAKRRHDATLFEVDHIDGGTGLRFVDRANSRVDYVRAVTFVRGAVRYGVTTGRPAKDPGSTVVALLAESLEQLALRRSPGS